MAKKSPPSQNADILVCARTENNPDVLQGSIWVKCGECNASIWVSLSGQRALKQNKNLVPVCIECAVKKGFKAGETQVKAAPGSLQEVRNYLASRKKH